MPKVILITGSTDGIGLEAAKLLAAKGHHMLLHGRNPSKLEQAKRDLESLPSSGPVESYICDLSQMIQVEQLAESILQKHTRLDVLINNAGVYGSQSPITEDGLDVRFAVNTLAPYLLTQRLLPSLGVTGRVINLSSAAQSPVDLKALAGKTRLSDSAAYAQSKLALTMWSRSLALSLGNEGPTVIAVNPGSFLGTKMVKQAFGMAGNDIRIGAEILDRSALDEDFATKSGLYFDNDSGQFAPPHRDALDPQKSREVVVLIEKILKDSMV